MRCTGTNANPPRGPLQLSENDPRPRARRARHLTAIGRICWWGAFPKRAGSNDLYQVYGNLLIDNPREALFQGSGRISFHDNVLIGGEPAAAVFRDHDLALKLAEVFDNRIYSPHTGIEFGSPARQGQSVFGNVIFAETPITGLVHGESGNIALESVRAVERSALLQ